jgi:hypothetical protein
MGKTEMPIAEGGRLQAKQEAAREESKCNSGNIEFAVIEVKMWGGSQMCMS